MSILGFIGTGVMGAPMAANLLAAGHSLHIHDVLPANMEPLIALGALRSGGMLEMAGHCEIIFLMVRDAAQVEEVLFGSAGAAEALTARHTLVCMSTLPAAFMRKIQQRLGHVAILDAPVSGGKAGAVAGRLAIMVGGEPEDFERVKPFLGAMGSNVTLVGKLGSGQTAKAANQIIVAVTRAAVGEALLFAARDGADPEQVRQALIGGLATSATLETYGARITRLENPVRFDSAIIHKDINGVIAAAEALGIDLPFAALAGKMYDEWRE